MTREQGGHRGDHRWHAQLFSHEKEPMANPLMAPKRIRDKNGNLVSFEQVYDLYFDAIFNYTVHRLGSVTDAEDVTAQTFYKAFKNIWQFRWKGLPISAWLYRIATNEANTLLRARQRQRETAMSGNQETMTSESGNPDSELAAAEQELAKHHMFAVLGNCIRELKTSDQTYIVLRYLEGKTFPQIAAITGKREGTVIMATHRALKKLKNHLHQRGIDHEGIRASFNEPAQTAIAGNPFQAEFAP